MITVWRLRLGRSTDISTQITKKKTETKTHEKKNRMYTKFSFLDALMFL